MMDTDNIDNIMKLEVKSNPELLASEKETQININNEGVSIHTDHRTGIKYCRQLIYENKAKLDYINMNDGYLVGIGIKTDYSLVTLKSVPRKLNQISSIFNI